MNYINRIYKYKFPFNLNISSIFLILILLISVSDICRFFKGGDNTYNWSPMKITTSVSFLLTVIALFLIKTRDPGIIRKYLSVFIFFLVIVLSGLTFFNHLDKGEFLTSLPLLKLFLSPSYRMTFFTSLNFLIISLIILTLLSSFKHKYNIVHVLVFPVFAISGFYMIGHLFKVYSFGELRIIPIAFTTSISFTCYSVALLFLNTDTWLMSVFFSNGIGGRIARRITFVLIILPVIIGWLHINGQRLGIFDTEEGITIVTITYIILFIILILITVSYGNSAEKLRKNSEEALIKSNAKFELLSDVAGKLLISEEPLKIVDDLCNKIKDFLGCDVFFNYLTVSDKLHLNAYSGIDKKDALKIEWLNYGEAVCGCVARDGKRIIEKNIDSDSDKRTSLICSYGVKAYVCHPLFSNESVIGTLSFGSKTKTEFADEEISLMKIVADQVAIAMSRIKNQEELRESEERFRTIAESLPVQISITGANDSKIKFTNESYNKTFGFGNTNLIGYHATDLYYHPEERNKIIDILKEEGGISDLETLVKKADGTPFWVSASIKKINYGSEPAYLSAIIDITQRKKAQNELLKLNRTLNALSKSSQAMMHATGEIQYLNEVCRIIIEDCGHLMVWVGYARNDEAKSVEPVAFYGFDKGYIENLNISWADTERGRGPTGTAIRTGKVTICKDMHKDPSFTPWREEALRRGYASSIVLPLLSDDKAFGSVSIYSKEPDSFSPQEVELLSDLANDLAYGISNIRLAEFEKKASKRLRESEEKYRLLFDSMSEGFALHQIINDENGKPCDYLFISINKAFEKQTGLASKDVVGKKISEVLPQNEVFWLETYAEVALTGKSIEFENYSKELNRYYRVSAFCPQKGYFATLFEDITEKVHAEKELHKTKNYLENLINYANAPIIVWNQESEIQLFNHAFERLTGYTTEEAEGRKLEFLFPEATLKGSVDKIKNALTKNWETIEIPILTKNKETRIVLWNSANIYAEDNKTIISTIAQGNDITERIQAENEVKAARDKLDLTLQYSSIGIWSWDISVDIFEIDDRIARIFGLETDNRISKFEEFEKNIFEEDIEHFNKAVKNTIQHGITLNTIFRIKTKDEKFIYINAKGQVERNISNIPVKMMGVCIDITEMRSNTEQVLFNLNEDLLRSNKELEQFAYVASHDLQEPLRMVSSFTQLLAKRYKDKLDKDGVEFINYAVNGAIRMQKLINDLLEFSRIKTRGKSLAFVDMNKVVSQSVNNVSLKINEKKASVAWANLPVVKADESQMVQLIQNLIDNAVKFCDVNPVIHISSFEENDKFIFKIKDNGIGIEPQYFERIFQIFQRLHLRDEYDGTGIGLAICKRIVERHGGKIWLESEKGIGTVFKFTIKKY